ncbi:uncharacterized protein N7529_002037 [Penicillium soppii]|uniref:uncharacterized protein n=1 Tax=Penicillium soppii TaxID=69789 RepID=UPI0025486876|nr:uncharacterized protein N7529_002037 [Penicillium soppii]KAJ5876453.1 hypothetical protein N7529_002037 [Penicillium soppii]
MLFPKSALITALCWLSTLSLASTLPLSTQELSLLDKWLQMSLNESAALNTTLSTRDTNNALVERTPINVCERIITVTAACAVITDFVIAMSKSLANTIKELSD